MRRLGNESGQTLVMVALSTAVLLGFAAFATDVGVMLHEKRLVQSAADSAAIATAKAISNHKDGVAAGRHDAALNGFSDGATDSSGDVETTVTINVPPKHGTFVSKPGYVEAIITQTTPTFFMHLFGRDTMNISGRAVATYLGNGSGCGYVNNPTDAPLAGNPWGTSVINSVNCGWLINGNLKLGANDAMNADYVGATGTITGSTHINGTYANGIPEFTDPLYWLSDPNYLPKVGTDSSGKPNCTSPLNSDGTAGPACYLNQTLTGTLNPGVYFYNNPTAAKYTGNVDGSAGVTIILTNGSLLSSTGASGVGNATLNLTAPSSGPYSGIVLDAPNYTGVLDLDFGTTEATFTGAVYAPEADLSLQDQGGDGVVINGSLVVGLLDVNDKNKGNLTINNYPTGIPSPIPRISLVE